MGNILSSLSRTVHISLAISIVLFLILFFQNGGFDFDLLFWSWLFRFIHVIVAIMWIGLLWYFNFVQIPNMAKIPDEQKPAIGKVIAPAALFSIYLFGGEILKGFSLAMILGVIFGTYSSIYIANPILVALNVSQRTIVKEEKD